MTILSSPFFMFMIRHKEFSERKQGLQKNNVFYNCFRKILVEQFDHF